MTPPPIAPCPVAIELVQYTPRRDGMLIQVSAADPAHPQAPLVGQSRLIQTTQRTVADDPGVSLGDVDWGDASVGAAVVSYFAAMGLTVEIDPNYLPGEAPPEEPPA